MAQKKTSKPFGVRNEQIRVNYYKKLYPPPHIVEHSKGSFGLFDITIIHFTNVDDTNEFLRMGDPGFEVFLVDVKTGEPPKVKQGRREFFKKAEELRQTVGILPGLHLLFDSRIRGSGVWTSESYPGDFEEE